MGVRIEGRISQEQAHIQVKHISLTGEDHAVNIHQQDAGQIKEGEAQGSPKVFNRPPQGVVTQKNDGCQDGVLPTVGQYKGEKPPNLSLQNFTTTEAKKVIQHRVVGHDGHKINDSGAYGNIEHQIRDTLAAVAQAEQIKLSAKIFQKTQLLINSFLILTGEPRKVYKRFVNLFEKNVEKGD